ncbi:MAG: zinc-binding dehydrogenase, partial [Anaerolineales bacterium]
MVTPSAVVFSSPGEVEIRQDPALAPQGDQVLVRTHFSAISAGTELMIYRGEVPENTSLDLPALSGMMNFPLRYGYSAVGEVAALGDAAPGELEGASVFAFQPHASHFVARADELLPLPEGLPLESALFLPNMESAVNFLHDGAPRVGERVVVFGQGVVGLLTAALLARIPLGSLITVDHHSLRREASLELGAHHALEPGELTSFDTQDRADLSYELSGDPAALSEAFDVTGFGGRIVLGSWYGTRPVSLDLGGGFHRSRIKLIGSQVSTLAPELTA